MRIHLVSDLHLDHDEDNGRGFLNRLFPSSGGIYPYRPEVLVVAGDWCSTWDEDITRDLLDHASTLYLDVILVPGNHEYWRTFQKPQTTPRMVNLALCRLAKNYSNVTVFEKPGLKKIGDYMFLGGTGWYPTPDGLAGVDQDFVDFRAVKADRHWFFRQHAQFLKLLRTGLADVVVSHHMPHPKSSDPQFAGSWHNHYFVQDLTDDIVKADPILWMHGHGHYPADHYVGDTRVVVHPRGYPYEYKNREPYEPKLIEV